MKYVALLRGINIGGRNKISMPLLVQAMETAGFQAVSTYINSGNIFFSATDKPAALAAELATLIEAQFGLSIKVLLRDEINIAKVAAALPDDWRNDQEAKCDILFLWPKYDQADILQRLSIKPAVDEVRYVDGALLWRTRRQHLTRSGLMSLPGSDLYAHMTIRNCNTLRKIAERLAGSD